MFRNAALVLLFIVLFDRSALGGIMLDGVPLSSYQSFAAQSQFRPVGQIGGASGTLIAPNWVITAAHVTGPTFTINNQTYTVDQKFSHPQFIANGGDIGYGFDIAMVKLTTNVVGVTPAQIYTGNNELNSIAAITGYGMTAIGSGANPSGGGTLLAGTNTIDLIDSFANGPSGQIGAINAALITDFDAPLGYGTPGQYNVFGSATPTSLEYHLAPGDSGGGLFLQENGVWYLAGLNSGVASQAQVLGSGNNQLFGYGAVSVMTRVSSYQSFINGFTPVPEPSSLAMLAISGIATGLWRRRAVRRRKGQVTV